MLAEHATLGKGNSIFCSACQGLLPIVHNLEPKSHSHLFLDFGKSVQLFQLSMDPPHTWIVTSFCLDVRVVSETALQLFPGLPNPLMVLDSCSQVPAGPVFPMMCQHSWNLRTTAQHVPRKGGLPERPA